MASTFLTSIPAALILYDPVLNDTDYILGAGSDTRVTLGALLEIFLMIGNGGTAVVMFPILRRYSESLSLSYVASRTIEATIIGVGAISLLSVVTLRDDLAASIGANGTSLNITGRTLVAIHDWTFLFSLPEAAFAIYLLVKGFRPSQVLDDARFAEAGGGSPRPAAAP